MVTSILRLPQVLSKTGLSKSTLYARAARDEFPRPIRLGARAVGWLESEIDEWLTAQVELSRRSEER